MRKLWHDEFKSDVLCRYDQDQEQAVQAFLRTLSDSPSEFQANLRLCVDFVLSMTSILTYVSASSMAGTIILRIAYGLEVQGREDPLIQTAEDTLYAINAAASFSGMLLDIIPFCA